MYLIAVFCSWRHILLSPLVHGWAPYRQALHTRQDTDMESTGEINVWSHNEAIYWRFSKSDVPFPFLLHPFATWGINKQSQSNWLTRLQVALSHGPGWLSAYLVYTSSCQLWVAFPTTIFPYLPPPPLPLGVRDLSQNQLLNYYFIEL